MNKLGAVTAPERLNNMNGTYYPARINAKSAEDYSRIIFSQVVYNDKLPVMQVMSMTEALRRRKVDVLKINMLTEKAKKEFVKINGR